METPVAPSAAPAPPAADQTPIPATQAALAGDSFAAYQDARAAERLGKPLEPVAATPAEAPPETPAMPPAPPPAPERGVSKRQQQINDYERTIAELRQRVSALETPRAAAPAPSTPASPPEPEWKRIAKLPDAPKLADFDSVEEHAAAMALFVSQTRETERQQATIADQRTRALQDQTQTFASRLYAAREADPDLITKIPPTLLDKKPLSGLSPGEPFTFGNVVMEAAFHAANPAAFLTHLHAHPEDAQRIGALPVERQLWELGQLAGRLAGTAPVSPAPTPPPPEAAPASPPTVSQFPQPTPTLTKVASTTDPVEAAFKRNDFAGYRAARQAERLASVR